jgi:hypothetical protein
MARWARTHDAGTLAVPLRQALARRSAISEKKMFGGICFLLRGNMLCGTGGPGYMFRVGKDQDRSALSRKGASAMEWNGRRFEGFVWVDPAACDGRVLKSWIALAENYVGKLPTKGKK